MFTAISQKRDIFWKSLERNLGTRSMIGNGDLKVDDNLFGIGGGRHAVRPPSLSPERGALGGPSKLCRRVNG